MARRILANKIVAPLAQAANMVCLRLYPARPPLMGRSSRWPRSGKSPTKTPNEREVTVRKEALIHCPRVRIAFLHIVALLHICRVREGGVTR